MGASSNEEPEMLEMTLPEENELEIQRLRESIRTNREERKFWDLLTQTMAFVLIGFGIYKTLNMLKSRLFG